jgi:cytoskeletal protein CcmA (bactofilin family)
MFNSKKEQQQPETPKKLNSVVDTLIGESASLKGNIHTEGNLRIDGQFEGEIMAQAEVVIGNHGFINGNMVGKNIMIYGEVHGNIMCNGLLEVMATGKVYGDVQVNSFKVQEGAILQGRINMTGATEIIDRIEDDYEIIETQTTA